MKDSGGPRPRHRVYGLLSAGEVVYIGVASAGRPSWETTWQHRDRIENAQASLFRSLGAEPTEVTLLGTVGLHQRVAYQVAGLLGAWFPRAMVEKPTPGGGPPGRPVSRIENGVVTATFPSRTAAAKALGVKAGKTDKLTFPVLTCAELDRTTCAFDWVIEDTLLAGQPGVLAGPKKVLKTTVVLAGGISIATGEPFLGKWKVPRPRNVLIMSGESGLATIQETMRRQCKAMGVNLPDVDKLFLSDAIPRFDNRKHLDALERAIEATRCEVLIIDPCYLAMPGVDAGNVFIQGERLGAVGGVCQKHGVGLLLCHHCRKRAKTRSSADYEPPELDDISWAGFSEYARQWILLGRREEYELGTGQHKLWLSIGGSAGHSALWGLDVDEGPAGSPRTWKVDLIAPAQARADKKGASIRQRLLDATREFPNGETKTGILDTARLKSDHATRAVFDALVSDGILLASTVTKNAIGYPGYRLAEGGASCPTQTK